ncbi:hypothetical protein [Flavobacterium faecale]|uniref:hypothetical protein n=1 Tax=Flavobacterium faecale TaxID=1355330 RepID=UPI003AABD6CF
MKNIIFLIATLLLFSCKKEVKEKNGLDKPKKSSDSLVYSSTALQPHLKFNSEYSEYELTGLKNSSTFTSKDINFPVKENDFNYNKSNDFDYYTISNFDIDKVHYKIIAYNSYGENDSKVLNVQLNSYISDKQIDALLLDCRFTFETEYYRLFKIKNNSTIDIKKIAVDSLLYNEEGDIIGKKTVNDTTIETVQYQIKKTGHFIKL